MSWKGDPDAIHTTVDAEISGLTEKATPVDADLVVIEDSADSNSKKKAQLGNLPSSGGASSIDDLTDVDTTTTTPTTGDVLEWDGTNWVPAEAASGGGGGSGEILISDTPSTPLVFGDLIQNEAQDDLVYAD